MLTHAALKPSVLLAQSLLEAVCGSDGSKMHVQCTTLLPEQLQQLAVYCDQEQ